MITDKTLLPLRHPQMDIFVADVFDAAPKGDTAGMAYPIFTLSTKPDMTPREHVFSDGKRLKISPSSIGLATVFDRDVLIYCISQCMAKLNAGEPIAKTMVFRARDLLITTNRTTSGEGYRLLKDAIKRLQGTQIETTITTGGIEQYDVFSLIERASMAREVNGELREMEVTLSDWVFRAIKVSGGDILTISRDYFRLRKPLERRIYELARKHCGRNNLWKLSVDRLHERSGSRSRRAEFNRMLRKIVDRHDHIPDYSFRLEGDVLYIKPKLGSTMVHKDGDIKPATFEKLAKKYPGLDLHGLAEDWREFIRTQRAPADNPDGSFYGFVKRRALQSLPDVS